MKHKVRGSSELKARKSVYLRDQQRSVRRHLPAQAGSMIDRRDAGALKNREAETGEEAIIAGLWKYHRLLPPIQNDPQRQRFHRMLILALYYSFIWIPMRITFFRDMPRDQPAWMAIDTVDVVIDVCFLIDVGLSFRTAFYDEDQNIITDWRVIVRQYLEFWFWIEAFSALQWDIIFGIIELRAVRLLRCLRLLKGKSKVTTQTVRLLRTVAFIGFLCHWVACIWWGLGASWINLNSSFGHSWIFRHSDWSDGEVCDPLPNSTAYKARAEAALQNLTDLVKDPPLTSHQLEVLRWNWQYAWCETPDGQLQHDFKLYLGSVDNLPTGLYRNIDASLIAQPLCGLTQWRGSARAAGAAAFLF